MVAASLVLMALLAGIAGTTWGLIRADRAFTAEAKRVKERDDALKEADELAKERDVAIKPPTTAPMNLSIGWASASSSWPLPPTTQAMWCIAADRLDEVPTGQRGWEWHYLKRLTRGGLFTLYGHTGLGVERAFSPDGSRIVTGRRPDGEGVGRADGDAPARAQRTHGYGAKRGVQPGRHAHPHRR